MDESPRSPVSLLNTRELECLRGVAAHKRTNEIAFDLGLKPKTVDTYIASAMRKLGAGDRDSAVRMLRKAQPDLWPDLWGSSPSGFSEVVEPPSPPANRTASRIPWPFPTSARPTNDLDTKGSFTAIAIASALLLAAAALYLLAIRMLSERI